MIFWEGGGQKSALTACVPVLTIAFYLLLLTIEGEHPVTKPWTGT